MAARKAKSAARKRAPRKRAAAKKHTATKKRTTKSKPRGNAPAKRRKASATKFPGTGSSTTLAGDTVGPSGIRIRMYRVGFGDFFLLSLKTQAGDLKHILIDCGVHAGDIGTINDAVAHMAAVTGYNLSLLIMTHRHADHISGFAKCKDVFSKFNVKQVWMSWFENPADPVAVKYQNGMAMVAQQLTLALAARQNPADKELKFMAENITGEPIALGEGGGASNAVALKVLHGGFKEPAPVAYYKAGDPPTLPEELRDAGLTAQILGPPHDLDLIKQMDGKNEEYLAENDPAVAAKIEPFDKVFRIKGSDYPKEAFHDYGRKDVEKSVSDVQPDLLAAKARQADNTLNNQSLVVLFSFHGKQLLFAGDAQWGNWENFLYGGKVGVGPNKLTDASKKILGSLDFYKVGHHGSTNATPKDALAAMREGIVAMVSTEPGCYGKPKSGTEVPRIPLLEAIEKQTDDQLARSDQIEVGNVKASAGLGAPGKPFSTGEGYIDYNL